MDNRRPIRQDMDMRILPWLTAGLLGLACLCLTTSAAEPAAPTPVPAPALQDRLNLWPLLYIDGDELSVLAPIYRQDSQQVALRPLFSWHSGKKRLRVLYPLAQFEFARNEWFVFPFYRGPDYTVAFPLYWDFRSPKGRTNWFFPLWAYERTENAWKGWTALGLVGGRQSAEESHRRVLPLFSSTRKKEYREQWWLPPLTCFWSDRTTGVAGRMILPFLFQEDSPGHHFLLTPVYARWTGPEGVQGRFVLPVGAVVDRPQGRSIYTLAGTHHRDGDTRRWFWWPLLSWGSSAPGAKNAWWAFPFGHSRVDATGEAGHFLPFYLKGKHPQGAYFASLLYASWRKGTEELRAIPMLLSWTRTNGKSSSSWYFAPFAHVWRQGEYFSRHVFPLFYRSHTPEGDITATLLGGRIRGPHSQSDAIFPLLSWRTRAPERTDTWIAAPLAHFSSGPKPGSSHVAPLYYTNPNTGTFLSPAYLKWVRAAGSTLQVLPLAATWWTRNADVVTTRILGGLGGFGGVGENRWSYLFPFYLNDPAAGSFLTPLYARWSAPDGTSSTAIPPLLAWWRKGVDRESRHYAAGLIGHGHSPTGSWSYVIPLYFREAGLGWLTPLAGRLTQGATTIRYMATPLIGTFDGAERGGWVFPVAAWKEIPSASSTYFRFLWATWHTAPRSRTSQFFPLWRQGSTVSEGKGFKSRIEFRNNGFLSRWRATSREDTSTGTRVESESYRLFPLWYRETASDTGAASTHRETSALLGLFKSRSDTEKGRVVAQKRRLLWYLWRYDRKGEEVHADAFPAITYDRLADGRERTTFLWKAYRKERAPDGRVSRTVLGISF